jgi:hypothetical protein
MAQVRKLSVRSFIVAKVVCKWRLGKLVCCVGGRAWNVGCHTFARQNLGKGGVEDANMRLKIKLKCRGRAGSIVMGARTH